ncbi:MAG: transporter substrate-binding domain-containing protein [Treponema sp.]|jgi:L-cystine transport system substrate-binding protein|nr:transporter substrate-binding domain-containing protein [Treponema sp.]
MKKQLKKRILPVAVLGAVVFAFSLPGCGSKTPSAQGENGSASAAQTSEIKPRSVIIAVGNAFIPYSYLDENDQLVGYEIQLLKAIDDLLPQYEFIYEIESDQWVSLNSGRSEVITHQWEKNAARSETYLFGNEMLTSYDSHLAFKPGRTDLNTAEDMWGKKIQVGQGSGAAIFLEAYNESVGNRIEIVYSSGGTEITLSKLDTGAIDAYLQTKRMIETTAKNYDTTIGISEKPIYSVYTYFVYRKDEPSAVVLRDAMDGALKKLRASGIMSALSLQWLGGDYTKWGPEHVED